MPSATQTPVRSVKVRAFRIPTEHPEADALHQWSATTLLLVEVSAAGQSGLGYTYADTAVGHFIQSRLGEVVTGLDAMDTARIWQRMQHALRSMAEGGIGSLAAAALDCALWDLKARLLGLPLVRLLGEVRESIAVYGSGGFATYTIVQLQTQLDGWVVDGIPRVKMRAGVRPEQDGERVRAAREAIGLETELYVNADGAYRPKQALLFAELFAELDVSRFEEPLCPHNLDGLRLLRQRAPAGVEIASGEQECQLSAFRRLMQAGALDCILASAMRCGLSGLAQIDALCQAFCLPLFPQGAPALHLHAACALPAVEQVEYFHDHQRVERMLFEGVSVPQQGQLRPDFSRPGMGLALREADAQKYAL